MTGKLLIAFAFGSLVVSNSWAAEPFSSATVSRSENQVTYGKIIGDKSETRPAVVNDVIKADNFLMSETNSRAELRYEDGSIVRIGQNTIFTFEANTRTLELKKGTFVFYVPKGKGGGTIKTPSLTAAITGTIGKVSKDIIAIVEGEITLLPSGRKVPEGSFARINPDGSISINPFDRTKEFDGKLMTFNGPLPGKGETAFAAMKAFAKELQTLEAQERTGNLPSGVARFHPTPPPHAPPGPTVVAAATLAPTPVPSPVATPEPPGKPFFPPDE